MSKQNIMIQKNEKLEKYHWVSFILVIYCWTRDLPVSLIVYPMSLHWRQIFFFPLQTFANSFCIGVGLMSPSHLRAGTPSGSDMGRLFACCQSPCEFISASVLLCLEGLASLVSCIPAVFYNLSASSSTVPCALRVGAWWRHLIRIEYPKGSPSLHRVQLSVSVFVPISCQK